MTTIGRYFVVPCTGYGAPEATPVSTEVLVLPPVSRLLGFTAPWFPAPALPYETGNNDRRGLMIFEGKLLGFRCSHSILPITNDKEATDFLVRVCVLWHTQPTQTDGWMCNRVGLNSRSVQTKQYLVGGCFLVSSCERGDPPFLMLLCCVRLSCVAVPFLLS